MNQGLAIRLGMMTALIPVLFASCAQTIPPRTYNAQTAKHLRSLAHDAPVTPIPSSCGDWGWYGCHYSWYPY